MLSRRQRRCSLWPMPGLVQEMGKGRDKARGRHQHKGKDRAKEISSTSDVEVREIKPQQVISIGVRGSYSMERFQRNKRKLTEWLAKNGKYEPAGEAYAVYWDGPFVIGFFKRSEVHLPIKPKETKPKGKQPSPEPQPQP